MVIDTQSIANEIIDVLVKHKVPINALDNVFNATKDIAYENTIVGNSQHKGPLPKSHVREDVKASELERKEIEFGRELSCELVNLLLAYDFNFNSNINLVLEPSTLRIIVKQQ